jgi:hypothetical protein
VTNAAAQGWNLTFCGVTNEEVGDLCTAFAPGPFDGFSIAATWSNTGYSCVGPTAIDVRDAQPCLGTQTWGATGCECAATQIKTANGCACPRGSAWDPKHSGVLLTRGGVRGARALVLRDVQLLHGRLLLDDADAVPRDVSVIGA